MVDTGHRRSRGHRRAPMTGPPVGGDLMSGTAPRRPAADPRPRAAGRPSASASCSCWCWRSRSTARPMGADASRHSTAQDQRAHHCRAISCGATTALTCHGPNGRGDQAPALNSQEFFSSVNDDQIHGIVAGGIPGTPMPAWLNDYGGPLTDQQIGGLVAYLRSLGADGSERPQLAYAQRSLGGVDHAASTPSTPSRGLPSHWPRRRWRAFVLTGCINGSVSDSNTVAMLPGYQGGGAAAQRAQPQGYTTPANVISVDPGRHLVHRDVHPPVPALCPGGPGHLHHHQHLHDDEARARGLRDQDDGRGLSRSPASRASRTRSTRTRPAPR